MRFPHWHIIVPLVLSATAIPLMENYAGAQSNPVTELSVDNETGVAFSATVAFSDGTTTSLSVGAANASYIATAPAGTTITGFTAGSKTVAIPMAPSPQAGWNIPGIGEPLYCHYVGVSVSSPRCRMRFSFFLN
jgi:hypothetical protein